MRKPIRNHLGLETTICHDSRNMVGTVTDSDGIATEYPHGRACRIAKWASVAILSCAVVFMFWHKRSVELYPGIKLVQIRPGTSEITWEGKGTVMRGDLSFQFCDDGIFVYCTHGSVYLDVVNGDALRSDGFLHDRNSFSKGVSIYDGGSALGTYTDVFVPDFKKERDVFIERVKLFKSVRDACDGRFGAGSYEWAHVEKSETDTAYCFALTLLGGTNCTIKVMKADGKVVCDEAPRTSEGRDVGIVAPRRGNP